MTNFNGTILDDNTYISIHNRGYAYGDALFETIKVANGKLLFWEDHYFRLMASMRIMRMEIPMNFTMEYLEGQISSTLSANKLGGSDARVKLTVHRNEGGLYLPKQNAIGYNISVKPLDATIFELNETKYEVDLFKDYYVAPSLLSTLKTNNKALNVIGSIFAKENALDNCLLLNTNKHVVEALNGNLFLVKDNIIKTPPLSDGCLKGVMRTQLLKFIKQLNDFELQEASISPFELQKADELFVTNVIVGIQPISKYRKKQFTNTVAKTLIEKLNVAVRLA
ncbi:aminotransferase class IV [Jejuia pallidilutea]|jgi:branched-chain amino acid aminotransferase|uniref:branched-chain-amino-acid transaminase n=1 Tax=Jejuia pallidilutea TaxID=504487 RepID=A0A090VLQ8_9FLAO|nr:aminotransferase class IV [Jejuia pallidilutea]PQV50601.1 branched-chain amino acid aminotransferase [Jejuia pallidilutea]GAL65651.1 aminodeoxychorismate lyase [Jejuia pallidilutea]GAL72708.1 aminodeoxychorismate lyase [Jejuia pallidilutea]GAL88670.1 aminodeoxychorismate lyase [Jejuia pallidilutea]